MDRGTWEAAVHGVAKSHTQLSMHTLYVSLFIYLLLSGEARKNENHSHRKLTELIIWITAWCNSVKLWAMPRRATQDRWVIVESSGKMCLSKYLLCIYYYLPISIISIYHQYLTTCLLAISVFLSILWISWRRAWQPTPVFLPRGSQGQRSLVGYSPKGCKELDMTEATLHARTQTPISLQSLLFIESVFADSSAH